MPTGLVSPGVVAETSWDVVVIGAGLAGAATALQAALKRLPDPASRK